MDRIRLLERGAEAFPRMLEAIRGARRTIHLESYIFLADEVGLQFLEALEAAARRGVRVEVVLDGFGSPDALSIAARLNAAGAEARVHGRLLALLGGTLLRNHRKLLLVDGEVAFAGGINIAAKHAAWADLSIEVRGPVCAALEAAVQRRRGTASDDAIRFLLSGPRGGRRLRSAYLRAIARARSQVLLAQAYFLPDRKVLRALSSAAHRGVDVRVLLAGPLDVPLIGFTSRHICRRLLRSGVRVFRWKQSMFHAKAAAFDGKVVLVGSFNLDPMSQVNEELLVEARDEAAAAQAVAWFDRHARHELTLEDCRASVFSELLGRFLSWMGFALARRLHRA